MNDFEDSTPLYAAFGVERDNAKPFGSSGHFIEGKKKTKTLWVGLGERKARELRAKTG